VVEIRVLVLSHDDGVGVHLKLHHGVQT
jgi:hypothetical protein